MNKGVLLLLLMFCNIGLHAQRRQHLLNDGWKFRFSHQVQKGSDRIVDIPHTWNAQDALAGQWDYKRGIGNYTRSLPIDAALKGNRLFLKFDGVNNVANVFINGKHLGEHRGGYGAFVFEITDVVKYGENNTLAVRVNNGEQLDIMPLVGDFNFYGGIYRDVHLLVTNNTCISPIDYASPGVYLVQQEVTEKEATVEARIVLNTISPKQDVLCRVTVKDGDKVIAETEREIVLNGNANQVENLNLKIKNPRLWNGAKDPFMYSVDVDLLSKGQSIDKITQPLGLRYFSVDPDKGFILNGQPLRLKGVCRHQDRAERGNALHFEHHKEDVDLMKEMGVNAVRLAHYPQATAVYDLMDSYGMVTWAEIPFIGPGGYDDKGYVNQPSFHANGKEQLKELIRQHYNHPSICFWGIFNELKEQGDNPVEYIKELVTLAHEEDATRPTTAASNQGGALNYLTDLIAWNRYDGWYGGMPKNLGDFLDATHKRNPKMCIGISEYGAGASVYHQQDTLTKTSPTSWWHPENWQTWYHIENWKVIEQRPFVWGSFVWNMFDFGAAHRTEGDRPGINDKGLVTFDRKIRKDAFYFYKANWNSEPMVYLAEKRNSKRTRANQNFMVFSNAKQVELFVNGKSMGKVTPDNYAIARWDNIPISKGENTIFVTTGGKKPLTDSTVIVY
ncbi:MAG: beta-glucuronidase LacZ4 [Marinifilaceae bacterium]